MTVPCEVKDPAVGSANAVAPSFRRNSSQVLLAAVYVTLTLRYSVPKSAKPVVLEVIRFTRVPCNPVV
jgi:hypothetical protein